MLRRKYYDYLLKWKEDRKTLKIKECLMVKGARQVGKTSLVEYFGAQEYSSFVSINFLKNPSYKEIFSGNLDAQTIISKISLYFSSFKLVKGDTLIFLDEIQNCGAARTALKFLAESFDFDVITSGSLLGLEYGKDDDANVENPDSIPVGYESSLTMYSLDFKEYLWAKGYSDEKINQFKSFFDNDSPIDFGINNLFKSLFREYIVIGGMPEVVETFIKTNDFNSAFKIQNKILANYQDDISKHARGEEKVKVRKCYDSIPGQLAKDLRRFQYSFVEKGKTSKKYGGSIKWLVDSCLVNACYNVSNPLIPLLGYERNDQFKLYINDTGLLTTSYGRETKLGIINDSLIGNVKGAIYENVISECLVKNGYKLHYYKPDDNHEIEFVIEKDGNVVPIEVKAGNSSSISLNNFIKDFRPNVAFKLINGNIGRDGVKKSLPHYMVLFI